MDDTPLDDRLRDKWKEDAETRALNILLDYYMSPEGKEWMINARQFADRERVKALLTIMHEKVVEIEEAGASILSADMIVVATTLLTAALGSVEFGLNRKSWEN